MNLEIRKVHFAVLIAIFLIAAIASSCTILVVDYVRDHESMRQSLIEKDQLIQIYQEKDGVHTTNAELLVDEVEKLKKIPVR